LSGGNRREARENIGMALPSIPEARPFYRSAWQRLEDALFLLSADRNTGAVYLAGYSVECMLKALILVMTPDRSRAEVRASFRGTKAHDFDWLRARYFERGGPPFSTNVAKSFSLVDTWTTDLRYESGSTRRNEAVMFLRAAQEIINWADGRL
jgi:HEPN domain-containing protein